MMSMIDPHTRLQHARKRAGFKSASDAARANNWNENTYRSHENGERGLKSATAARYGRAFSVSTAWLLAGEGSIIRESINFITLIIVGDGVAETWYPEGAERSIDKVLRFPVDLPTQLPSQCLIGMIATADLYPKYENGSLVVAWGSHEDLRKTALFEENDKFDALYSFGGKNFFKTIARSNDNTFTVFHPSKGAEAGLSLKTIKPIRLIVPKHAWAFVDNDRFQDGGEIDPER